MWLWAATLAAQHNAPDFWTPLQPAQIALPESARQVLQPRHSQLFRLDVAGMRQWLSQAPLEFTGQRPLRLQVPDASGQMRLLEVWESPVMAPELAAKYPGIRTYAARPLDGSPDVVRLGIGDKGFYAFQLRADGDIVTVRPMAEGQDQYYMAYRLSDLPNAAVPAGIAECGVADEPHPPVSALHAEGREGENAITADRSGSGDPVKLKKYRAAISGKGEYSKFHGNTVPLVLSAMTEALNFIAAIMERDFSLRIELVADNDKLIYLDAATDPYEGTEVGEWMDQNHAVVTNIIGSTNFDIGHVFSVYVTGSAVGVAGGRVCNNSNKARACSSALQPTGEYFYLVTAHEMCHQMSGDHTWNTCTADLVGQRRPASTMEPGSGSTIMSYAGSCGSNNVQSNKDSYFHVRSIDQVRLFYTSGTGTCGSSADTDNASAPDVSISSPANVFIPILTPFQLNATASDADGDVLTCVWEQYDAGPEVPLGEQDRNSALFRSFNPTAATTRIFPRLPNIITNTTSKSELLPDTTRVLNFRFTARDNHPGAGGQTWANIRLNATLTAGPFKVAYPNTSAVIWYGGEDQVVTWDVANTNKAPVNCERVNILLSTDNGNTYDYVLAANVPNTGRCCVKVPDIEDNLCRIRVEGVGNVFFDLSNAAFKIRKPTQPYFTLCTTSNEEKLCLPQSSVEITVSSILGYSTPVALSATGLPAGVSATFSPNPALPGTVAKMTLQVEPGQPEATFEATITGSADGLSKSVQQTISLIFNDFSQVKLKTPANGAMGISQSPALIWGSSPDADTYEVQVASNPSFEASTLKAQASGLSAGAYTVPVLLEKRGVYYWRVRPLNACGAAAWTEPFVFSTSAEACSVLSANDLPKPITASGTPIVSSIITLNTGGTVSDVNIKSIAGNHTFFRDLEFILIGPDGTAVALAKDRCGSFNGTFDFGFDDESAATFACPPSQTGTPYKPISPLAAFKGKNAQGSWTLQVKDNATSSGGNLLGYELEVCSSVSLDLPLIVTNQVLQLPAGTNAPISSSLLKAEDASTGAAQLTYTLVTVPKTGELQIGGSGTAAQPGAQFTQADVDGGALRYYDYGAGGDEQFRFVVTDGEGGFVQGTFLIKKSVRTQELYTDLDFEISPNPATDQLRLSFPNGGETVTQIGLFNMAGQQMRSLTLPRGTQTYMLDLAQLPSGLYILTAQTALARGAKKVAVK